jgi:tRNA(fMet)-specific endonuclease VapC
VSLWVLDTDHVSLLQRGNPLVSQRLEAVNPEEIAVTIVTVEEQFGGRLHVIRQGSSRDEILLAYDRLMTTLKYFGTVNVLDFDEDAWNCYTDLVSQKIRIGTRDLRIAAVVMSKNAILVTRNRRDFERVPGLRFEDWTI